MQEETARIQSMTETPAEPPIVPASEPNTAPLPTTEPPEEKPVTQVDVLNNQ
jgi:hypothetical protein